MNDPLISILIPTYNRARFVREAVESALNQHCENIEVVVVDDGSTDETADIVKDLDDPRVRYIKVDHGGVSRARNRAIEEARGEFLLWLDSDDLLKQGAIGVYVAALEEHADVDIAYGQWDIVDDEGNTIGARRFEGFNDRDVFHELLQGCVVPQPGCFVRKTCYDAVGNYDPTLEVAEDYDFFARAAGRCRFLSLDKILYSYRNHGDQLCGAGNETDKRCERIVIRRMIERHGYRKLYPDLYEPETGERGERTDDRGRGREAESDIGSMFRLAAVFHERNGPQERDEMFRDAVAQVRRQMTDDRRRKMDSRGSGGKSVAVGEAGEMLYKIGLTDRKTYRSYAFACRRLWPWNQGILKHLALSLLPGWLHRALKARRV